MHEVWVGVIFHDSWLTSCHHCGYHCSLGWSRPAPGLALLYRDFVPFRGATQAVHLRPERKPQAGWEGLTSELVRCLWNIGRNLLIQHFEAKRMGWFQVFDDFKQKSIREESSQIAHFSCETYGRLCCVRFLAGFNPPVFYAKLFFFKLRRISLSMHRRGNFPRISCGPVALVALF